MRSTNAGELMRDPAAVRSGTLDDIIIIADIPKKKQHWDRRGDFPVRLLLAAEGQESFTDTQEDDSCVPGFRI